MFDMHYDLLTLLYVLKDDKKYVNKVVKEINNNLKGLAANLFFMSKKEMKEELNIEKIDVSKMLKEATDIYKNLNIKPKVIFSIEGCDYIKDLNELEYLNKLGLKAILPVWNNKNKYGSGIRTRKGLTNKGKKLIKKAIELNIAIDLSHAGRKTFNDIIKIIKKSHKKPICYASHSNIYELKKHPRNLNKNQLEKLKDVNGYLGIVSYKEFLTSSNNIEKAKKIYLNHIKYAVNILGIDRVVLSTDDMTFYNQIDNKE